MAATEARGRRAGARSARDGKPGRIAWNSLILVALLVFLDFGHTEDKAMFFAMEVLDGFPVTLDPSVPYFGPGLLGLLTLTALVIFGFTRSLGAHTIFAEPVLED